MLSLNKATNFGSSLLLVACLFLVSAVFGQETEKKADVPKGRWDMTEMEVEGETVPKAIFAGWNFVFNEDALIVSVVANGQTHRRKFAITLNPRTSPNSYDAKVIGGPDNNKVLRGIYKLNGNILTFCGPDVPQEHRPKDFSSKKGSPFNIFTLSRSKL